MSIYMLYKVAEFDVKSSKVESSLSFQFRLCYYLWWEKYIEQVQHSKDCHIKTGRYQQSNTGIM
jgi:hypothetical protein